MFEARVYAIKKQFCVFASFIFHLTFEQQETSNNVDFQLKNHEKLHKA